MKLTVQVDNSGGFLSNLLPPPVKGLDVILKHPKWPTFKAEVECQQERTVAAMQDPNGCAPEATTSPPLTTAAECAAVAAASSVASVIHKRPFADASMFTGGSSVQQLDQILAEWRGESHWGEPVAVKWANRKESGVPCNQCTTCRKQFATLSALPRRMEQLMEEGHARKDVLEALAGVMDSLKLTVADMRDAFVSAADHTHHALRPPCTRLSTCAYSSARLPLF